jgi:hypothetical protein
LPSYLPFAETAWVGQDLVQGVEWALANPREVSARIHAGQSIVLDRFASDVVGRQWRELFETLVPSH